jgi:hypothetical protein
MLEIELRLVEEVGSIPRRMGQYKVGFAGTRSLRGFFAGLDRTMETHENQIFAIL